MPVTRWLGKGVNRALVWRGALGGALLCAAQLACAQQSVGKIEFAQGLTTVQPKDAEARFVAKGDALFEGDVVTTTDKGYALLSLPDGMHITLRPSTSFAIAHFAHEQGTENVLLRLLKGGLRATTGLIGKRNPDGFRLATPSATIGIRGTEFDARLCDIDCRHDQLESRPPLGRRTPIPPADTVVARVVRIVGSASITPHDGVARGLLEGSPLVPGDQIVTAGGASVVLGFRDQTRVSLEPQTVFRVDEFKYHHPDEADSLTLRLLKGGMRAFTGLIAKANPKAVTIRTSTTTIGIRGTGMDISCEGPCAAASAPASELCRLVPIKGKNPAPACDQGLFVHTWDGLISMAASNQEVDVPLEQAGFSGADAQPRLLPGVPDFMSGFVSPRPDTVEVDWSALFGGTAYDGEDGLYTLVRDGYVFVDASGGHLDMGPGEASVVGADGTPRRLDPVPAFLLNDPFPTPEDFDASSSLVLQLFGATLGTPGQEMCEIK